MLAEIRQQPEALDRTLASQLPRIERFKRRIAKNRPRLPGILASSHVMGRIEKVEQVMRCSGALLQTRLRRTNVEVPIHCHGVTIHDFSVEFFGESQREGRLSTCRRPKDHDQKRFRTLR